MSTFGELLEATQKVLVLDNIKRLSMECDALATKVSNHEDRLLRMETIVAGERKALSSRSTRGVIVAHPR